MTEVFACVAGGGTGGHTLPGLAIAEALVAAGHDRSTIHFVGGTVGPERTLVPDAGFRAHDAAGPRDPEARLAREPPRRARRRARRMGRHRGSCDACDLAWSSCSAATPPCPAPSVPSSGGCRWSSPSRTRGRARRTDWPAGSPRRVRCRSRAPTSHGRSSPATRCVRRSSPSTAPAIATTRRAELGLPADRRGRGGLQRLARVDPGQRGGRGSGRALARPVRRRDPPRGRGPRLGRVG